MPDTLVEHSDYITGPGNPLIYSKPHFMG